MRKLMLIATVLSAMVLAGCTGTADDGGSDTMAKTYSVPIKAAHALNGADRTIAVTVTQGGAELGKATYSTSGQAKDDFVTLFTVDAAAGALKIQAFEGSNPLNFKSIDAARCTDPDFQIHVVDAAVHLWSNCD